MSETPPKEVETTVAIRRAPKFLQFAITGAIIGALIAVIRFQFIPEAARSNEPFLGLLLAYFAGVGLGVGLVAAVILDAIFRARSKRAAATKLEA